MAHQMLDDWGLPPDIGPDGEPLDDDASCPPLVALTVTEGPADVANLADFEDGSEDNDSCISLPPDVLTADEDEEMLWSGLTKACRCARQCPTSVDTSLVAQLRHAHFSREEPDRSNHVFEFVKSMLMDADGMVMQEKGHKKYSVGGVTCCRKFWEFAHGLRHNRVGEISRMIRAGATQHPKPRRRKKMQTRSEFCQQTQAADAWFLRFYTDLCMPESTPPGATGSSTATDNGEYQTLALDNHDHPLWNITMGLDGIKHARKIYWLWSF